MDQHRPADTQDRRSGGDDHRVRSDAVLVHVHGIYDGGGRVCGAADGEIPQSQRRPYRVRQEIHAVQRCVPGRHGPDDPVGIHGDGKMELHQCTQSASDCAADRHRGHHDGVLHQLDRMRLSA